MTRARGIRPKRATPRRREAPRWDWDEWVSAGHQFTIRSGGACEICGTLDGPFERHHRKRRRDGGDRFSNILILCSEHHRWVTEHPKEARAAGWIVSVARDPASVPVLWRREVWVFLDDQGGMTPCFEPVPDAHA